MGNDLCQYRQAIGLYHASGKTNKTAWSAWDASLFTALLDAGVLSDVLSSDEYDQHTEEQHEKRQCFVIGSSHMKKYSHMNKYSPKMNSKAKTLAGIYFKNLNHITALPYRNVE